MAETISRNIPVSTPKAALRGWRSSIDMTSSKGNSGSARNRSVRRISSPSRRRKYPARTPISVPMNTDRTMPTIPTANETCPPFIIRAKMSRPNWSVPNGCATENPWLRDRMSI